jgi:chlorite dismutase
MTTLWNVTGHSTKAELRAEADKLITYLRDHIDEMSEREATFMTNMLDQAAMSEEWVPSPKQLFWMRDLNEKF